MSVSNPQSLSDNTDLDSKLDEIFKQFYDLGADSVLIDWERQDYKKLKKTAHTQIKHLITQARIDELKWIMAGEKTVTQYADPGFKDLITYVFSAQEIKDRLAKLKAKT